MKRKQNRRGIICRRGFTLVEMLIVLTILAFIIALAGSNYITVKKKGRDSERKHDLKQISEALEMYYNDFGSYPAAGTFSFGSLWQGADGTIYMKQVPQDPKNAAGYSYVYLPVGATGAGWRLYTRLENDQDPDYQTGGYSGTDCGGGLLCTYGISSPNIVF